MARTWADLRALYLQATDATPAAALESWSHLGEAQRALAGEIDVPELAAIDTTVVVVAGDDYVAVSNIDVTVFAIRDCFNMTERIPMYPEPAGMTGRRLYLSNDGKPDVAALTHYQRDGVRLYVRGTAAVDTTLRVRVQRQMPDLSASSAGEEPITPAQYDRALVHKAAELYFLIHPRDNAAGGDGSGPRNSQEQERAYNKMVASQKSVPGEEAQAHSKVFRLSGFRPAPRSRRGR